MANPEEDRSVSEPAYTPMGPPVRCMTPGHEDREGRLYPARPATTRRTDEQHRVPCPA